MEKVKEESEECKKVSLSTYIKVAGLLALIAIIVGLLRNNNELRKKNWQLQGHIQSQDNMISGLRQTVERTSYVNGKLSASGRRKYKF